VAGEVAFRALDLEDACAGIGEPARAGRRSHRLLERNDKKSCEGKSHCPVIAGLGPAIPTNLLPLRNIFIQISPCTIFFCDRNANIKCAAWPAGKHVNVEIGASVEFRESRWPGQAWP
jgi:hypothetical protein